MSFDDILSVRASVVLVVLFLTLGCAPRSQPTGHTAPPRPKSALLTSIRAEFLKVNPQIRETYVLEVRPNPMVMPGKEYALLATGIAPNPDPEINFSNELFGVFTIDSTLTEVLRVIDIFATPRWKDYWVRFEFIVPDSLIVRGSGRAYGDARIVRTYDWMTGQPHRSR